MKKTQPRDAQVDDRTNDRAALHPWQRKSWLYHLLPTVYRRKDVEVGEPLRALMDVLATEYQALTFNMEALYDEWFIATCQEWVVPYIAELLLLDSSGEVLHRPSTERSRVARTLAYRRRKGGIASLSRAAGNATGWPCRGLSPFDALVVSQNVSDVRLDRGRTVDLRREAALETLGTPFDTVAHCAGFSAPTGWPRPQAIYPLAFSNPFGLSTVGLCFWRLRSLPVERVTARHLGAGRYTFNPLGLDVPLFNSPRTESNIARQRTLVGLPTPLQRAPLRAQLDARRSGHDEGTGYFSEPPVFQIFTSEAGPQSTKPVPLSDLRIEDLSDWGVPCGFEAPQVAVDPVLGRMLFAGGREPDVVRSSYSYGAAGYLGGGPYPRSNHSALTTAPWRAVVYRGARPSKREPNRYATVQAALTAWKKSGSSGVIEIADSATYYPGQDRQGVGRRAHWSVSIGKGHSLSLVAAEGAFPCLRGNLAISGEGEQAEFCLDGVLVAGKICLHSGGSLRLRDSTVWPDGRGAAIESCGALSYGAEVTIERCIVGSLALSADLTELSVDNSVIDGHGGWALTGCRASEEASWGPGSRFVFCTVFGQVKVKAASAKGCIFDEVVTVRDRQAGEFSNCYVPGGSETPRLYRCQPSLSLDGDLPRKLEQLRRLRLRPVFTSKTYGHPGYAQLAADTATEILEGAADGSEMGVFHDLYQPQRQVSLDGVVDEYLRTGLEASCFWIT